MQATKIEWPWSRLAWEHKPDEMENKKLRLGGLAVERALPTLGPGIVNMTQIYSWFCSFDQGWSISHSCKLIMGVIPTDSTLSCVIFVGGGARFQILNNIGKRFEFITVIGSTVQWRRMMPIKRLELKFWVDVALVFVQWSLTPVKFLGSWDAILGLIWIYDSLKKYIYYVPCSMEIILNYFLNWLGRSYRAVHSNLRLTFVRATPTDFYYAGLQLRDFHTNVNRLQFSDIYKLTSAQMVTIKSPPLNTTTNVSSKHDALQMCTSRWLRCVDEAAKHSWPTLEWFRFSKGWSSLFV